ncbi:MAG TPA: hypothetical protein VHM20_02155 [Gammaproteobacteria bacterium]|jgi:hypothetical protein|nr:hypothetical protein [Gammaproteobacteria bacterium]
MFTPRITPADIKNNSNMQQTIAMQQNGIEPIKLTAELVTNFNSDLKQILIEEKISERQHEQFMDAYAKMIDYHIYMSEPNTRTLLLSSEAKSSSPYVEFQAMQKESDRIFHQLGYSKNSERFSKIHHRVLELPLLKNVMTTYSNVLAQEAVGRANTFDFKKSHSF